MESLTSIGEVNIRIILYRLFGHTIQVLFSVISEFIHQLPSAVFLCTGRIKIDCFSFCGEQINDFISKVLCHSR